jgi:hypothetical protein
MVSRKMEDMLHAFKNLATERMKIHEVDRLLISPGRTCKKDICTLFINHEGTARKIS